MRAVLLLLCLPCLLAEPQTWIVRSLGDEKYTTQGPAGAQQSEWLAVKDATTNLYTTYKGKITWYSPPNKWARATTRPAGTTTVYEIASSVFYAIDPHKRPQVVFWGGGTTDVAKWECSPAFFEEFYCWIETSTGARPIVANYSKIGTEDPTQNPLTLSSVFIFDGAHPQHFTTFLTIAFYRAEVLRNQYDMGNKVISDNDERIRGARSWGAGIIFLIAVSMEATLVQVVILHAWLIKLSRLSYVMNFLMWLAIFFIIQQIISIAGGFPGWMAMYIILCFYFMILVGIYACLSCKRHQRDFTKKPQTFGNGASAGGVPPGPEGIEMGEVEQGGKIVKTAGGITGVPPPSASKWSSQNDELGKYQKIILVALIVVICVLMTICLLVFYLYEPAEYALWSRTAQTRTSEFAPATVGKTTLMMYMYPRMATVLNFDVFAVYTTQFCDYFYNKELKTNEEKKVQIFDNYIDKYSIDMAQYNRTKYWMYSTVNDWFTRALADGVRPLAYPNDESLMVAGCDSRYMVFENINTDLHVWLKHEDFTPFSLLDVEESNAREYVGGTMVVARLAPADYHRFHSPVSAKVGEWRFIPGTILSVNADAAQSGNSIYYNSRHISFFETQEFGRIAYVAIGATCVGSVVPVVKGGQNIVKGQEVGYMQFGGSTVVFMIPKGKIQLDADLLFNSRRGLETFMELGESLGRAIP